jgi:glycosyltransferase involved in cell wall biosynthesis
MKILIFNWQDIKNPLAGGAEVHLHEIFSRVVRLGHEVTLFCSSFPGAPREETINGIKVIREGGRYLFNYRVMYRYLTKFRHEKYDVVIDDMNKIPFFTPLYIQEPLYAIIHHLFDKSIFQEAPLPLAIYVYYMEKLGVALLRRHRIPLMVVSPSTRAEMWSKGYRDEDMQYAYNCVDHGLHRSDGVPKSATPLIGYFGRLKKYKSPDHLLRAFTIVKKTVPDLQLVVIGDGDYKKTLEALARELGIEQDVRFTGFVDENEKVRLLQQMWFMVNTSSKEGWGLTVVEANACGSTVLGSNVPGLRDAIKDGETGLLYEYGNIDELASKMNLLLNDASLRTRLTENAKQWSLSFDWSVVAKQVAGLLESEIQRHRSCRNSSTT